MRAKILHLYRDPMCLTSSYTLLEGFVSLLKQKYMVDSKFAIVNDVVYKETANKKFKNELIPISKFFENEYDVLVIEGHPQPQSDFSRIDFKTIRDFFDKGGIVFHTIGIGDLYSYSDVPTINNFLKKFYLSIDTFTHENDIKIGFDKEHSFRDYREFIIEVNKKYRFDRTEYPKIFVDVEKIAVSYPFDQEKNVACRTLLMGNPTTQLLSRSDRFVDDILLTFGEVNERGGFYILITGYLLEDDIVNLTENDNFKFGINLFEYFINKQKERNKKLKMKSKKCFLSYNHKDRNFAERLGKDLIENGIDVWYDKWEIHAGESIIGKIEEGLRECNYFLIIMSPNSMKSDWVIAELRSALYRRLSENSILVIPILLQQCEIPELLRDIRYIDFRKDYKKPFQELLKSIYRIPLR